HRGFLKNRRNEWSIKQEIHKDMYAPNLGDCLGSLRNLKTESVLLALSFDYLKDKQASSSN
ncbi:MAG TPA: hypothetical protein VFH07_04975, partial [Chitinophagaceae bacterium]|nr:hypothetical protein [Chitinophagaceae bacterium]